MRAEGRSLTRMQANILKALTPKQRSRFKKLTSSGLFKVKCGEGRKGRQCRQRKSRLLRKIARKVAWRKHSEERRGGE